MASDAITGGQAIGLFGKKKSPEEQKKTEAAPTSTPQTVPSSVSSPESSQTVVPATLEARSDECAIPASTGDPSSTILGAQEVVKFAETPNHSQ